MEAKPNDIPLASKTNVVRARQRPTLWRLILDHDDLFQHRIRCKLVKECVSDIRDVFKSALDHADTEQELARASAPGETLALYETMGRVLEQIEDVNRAGKIAFDTDAATRAKFNKDILLRARKERSKKKDEPAPPPQRAGAAHVAQGNLPPPTLSSPCPASRPRGSR